MSRRSHRQHQGGRSAEFLDDDDQYEGHAAARERNREFYARTHGDDDDLPPYKGRRARRTDKANRANAALEALEEDDIMQDYETHYKFIETTVDRLIVLYLKVLDTHTSLKALALKTMVNTQMEAIDMMLSSLPDWGYVQMKTLEGDKERVDTVRAIHEKHKLFIEKMSKIAKAVLHLHPHLKLWYTLEGQDWCDGPFWRDFDESCSKIPAVFPGVAGKTPVRSNLAT